MTGSAAFPIPYAAHAKAPHTGLVSHRGIRPKILTVRTDPPPMSAPDADSLPLADDSPSERPSRPHGAVCHSGGGVVSHEWLTSASELVVLGLLVFEFKLLRHDLAISIPVLVGEHVLHNHLGVKTGSELAFARRHLGVNVL